MPRIVPERLSSAERLRIDRWLVANGVREHVALVPVTVRGRYIEYGAMCRRDDKSILRGDLKVRRKRVLMRVPLAAVA